MLHPIAQIRKSIRSLQHWRTVFFFFLTFILFLRQRETAWTAEGQREGDTESGTGSRLGAVSTEPHAGLELMDHGIMTWAKVSRLTNWATQAPLKNSLNVSCYYSCPMPASWSQSRSKLFRPLLSTCSLCWGLSIPTLLIWALGPPLSPTTCLAKVFTSQFPLLSSLAWDTAAAFYFYFF